MEKNREQVEKELVEQCNKEDELESSARDEKGKRIFHTNCRARKVMDKVKRGERSGIDWFIDCVRNSKGKPEKSLRALRYGFRSMEAIIADNSSWWDVFPKDVVEKAVAVSTEMRKQIQNEPPIKIPETTNLGLEK